MREAPLYVEAIVATLLVLSGLFALVAAIAFWRLQDFFLRMHPPALTYTFGTWCVALAAILYISVLERRVLVHPVLIVVLLFITVPVTTLLLARVTLFRRRTSGVAGTPGPLSPPRRP